MDSSITYFPNYNIVMAPNLSENFLNVCQIPNAAFYAQPQFCTIGCENTPTLLCKRPSPYEFSDTLNKKSKLETVMPGFEFSSSNPSNPLNCSQTSQNLYLNHSVRAFHRDEQKFFYDKAMNENSIFLWERTNLGQTGGPILANTFIAQTLPTNVNYTHIGGGNPYLVNVPVSNPTNLAVQGNLPQFQVMPIPVVINVSSGSNFITGQQNLSSPFNYVESQGLQLINSVYTNTTAITSQFSEAPLSGYNPYSTKNFIPASDYEFKNISVITAQIKQENTPKISKNLTSSNSKCLTKEKSSQKIKFPSEKKCYQKSLLQQIQFARDSKPNNLDRPISQNEVKKVTSAQQLEKLSHLNIDSDMETQESDSCRTITIEATDKLKASLRQTFFEDKLSLAHHVDSEAILSASSGEMIKSKEVKSRKNIKRVNHADLEASITLQKKTFERKKNKWQLENEGKEKEFWKKEDLILVQLQDFQRIVNTPVGLSHQAEIPNFNFEKKANPRRKPVLVWNPNAPEAKGIPDKVSQLENLLKLNLSEEKVIKLLKENNNDFEKVLVLVQNDFKRYVTILSSNKKKTRLHL